MNMKVSVLSTVLVAAVSLGIGYGVNEMIRPGPLDMTQEVLDLQIELDQARQDNTKFQDSLSSLHAELDQALKQLSLLQRQLAQSQEELEVANDAILATAPEDSEVDASNRTETSEQRSAERRSRMDDPAVRRMRRAGQEMSAKRTYTDLLNKLDFTDEQSEQFIKLVVDSQLEAVEAARIMARGDLSAEEYTEAKLRLETMRERHEQKVRDLLGDDFQVYKEYSDTIDERNTVNMLSSLLREPLDDHTKEELVRIIAEEEEAAGLPEMQEHFSRSDSAEAMNSLDDPDYLTTVLEGIKNRDERVSARAESYLTAQQHKTFVTYLETSRTRVEFALMTRGARSEFTGNR
jgi:hypothetical protein|tara:strand:- start:3042 stop:4088 length:1047 start_codon:yes stop_codon:yes gene_type:complete